MSATGKHASAWREAKLGEVLPLKYGKARSELHGYPNPDTPAFGSNGAFGTYTRALTQGPSILVGRKGAAGAVHFSAGPCWPIDTTYYTEGNEGILLPFFRYLLESLRLSQFDRSTAIPSLSRDDYDSRIIQFPEELDEQRRVVAEIEKQFTRLDAGVAALRRAQANLKRYRTAVLKAACEGRLVPTESELAKTGNRKANFETGEALLARILTERRKNWQGRGQYKEPAAPDTENLPGLPKGWAWAALDQIGQEGRPIIYGIIKPGPHIPDGVPYVRVTEMKDGRIDVPNLRRASRERAAKFARATLASGDVLISKDGTIGRVAVVPPELTGGNITQHVMRAPIHEMMSREFVVWAIRSDWCQHWLTGETRGVALRGVNVEDFRRLPIPIPPISEQIRIVAEVERRLSVVEELETMVSANLQHAAGLRQSILHKAFSGQLIRAAVRP